MNSPTFFRYPLILASVCLSTFFVIFLLYYCQVGMDFTDEGFYLNWIAYPFLYKVSHTQFGYIYHPLYIWLGENMIRLRQVNMLIMLGLSWVVGVQLFDYLARQSHDLFFSKWLKYALSFSLATCIFSFFSVWWWIPTPSYNTLTIEALLAALIGLFEIIKNNQQQRGWMILGLAWVLAFMAKPTSALLLMPLSVLFLVLTQYKTLAIKNFYVLMGTAVFVFCLFAYLIDHSILTFIARIRQGVNHMALLYEGEMFHLFPHQQFLPDVFTQKLFGGLIVLLLTIFIAGAQRIYKLQSLCLLGLICLSWVVCVHGYRIPFYPNPMQCFLFLAVPCAMLLIWMALQCFSRIKVGQPINAETTRQAYVLAIFLLMMPYLFSFGTNGDVWMNALRMGFFWTLPAIVLIHGCRVSSFFKSRLMISIIVCSQCVTILFVELGMEYPYRQSQSLFTQKKVIAIQNHRGKEVGHIKLSDSYAYYIEHFRQAAFSNGFHYGDPMIDLSGSSPGALYLLGAAPIGAPWYIDGFGGSTDYILRALSETPCRELARSWVLTSFDGYGNYYPYHPAVLEASGLPMNAFEMIPDAINGGYRLIHQVMKPKRNHQERLDSCTQAHQNQEKAYAEIALLLPKQLPLSKSIYMQGLALMDKHQVHQATMVLKNATIINPSSPYLYNALCVAYGVDHQYDEAISACSAGLAIEPHQELIRNNLEWVTRELKVHSVSSLTVSP